MLYERRTNDYVNILKYMVPIGAVLFTASYLGGPRSDGFLDLLTTNNQYEEQVPIRETPLQEGHYMPFIREEKVGLERKLKDKDIHNGHPKSPSKYNL